QRLAEIKNLIRQRHDEFPQKNPAESIDCFPLRAYSSVLRRCRSGEELKSIARNVGNIERYLRQAEGILYNFATLFNKTDYR
ncbi:TPA: hypothetical protein ACFJIO_002041, partial [Neisseria gonorrhoeae]